MAADTSTGNTSLTDRVSSSTEPTRNPAFYGNHLIRRGLAFLHALFVTGGMAFYAFEFTGRGSENLPEAFLAWLTLLLVIALLLMFQGSQDLLKSQSSS